MSLTENNIALRRLLETTSITGASASIVLAAVLSSSIAVTPLIPPEKYECYTINEVPSAKQISKIAIWTDKENYSQSRTPLGKRLSAIRGKAISKGLTLLDANEILSELSRRRGDIISA